MILPWLSWVCKLILSPGSQGKSGIKGPYQAVKPNSSCRSRLLPPIQIFMSPWGTAQSWWTTSLQQTQNQGYIQLFHRHGMLNTGTYQMDISITRSLISTFAVLPALINTRSKPRSTRIGSSVWEGYPRYSFQVTSRQLRPMKQIRSIVN